MEKMMNVYFIMAELVAVGVGQCGVQMASSLIDVYMGEAQHYVSPEAQSRFFSESRTGKSVARCVLIDTESKAVSEILQNQRKTSNWEFDPYSVFAEGSGSGNNWASGYNQPINEDVLNKMRLQMENCDRFGGFLLFQSLAGGTGSGFGSKITESVHDHFQDAYIVNQVVWPYNAGEVLVQSYNSVLTLSTLLKNSNAIFLGYNDVLHDICADTKGKDNVTFNDMNVILARQLSSFILPSNAFCPVPMWSMPLAHFSSTQHRKLYSIFTQPILAESNQAYSIYNWDKLIDNTLIMAATGNLTGKNLPTVGSVSSGRNVKKCDALWMVLRGEDLSGVRDRVSSSQVLRAMQFDPMNDSPVKVSTSTVPFNGNGKFATVVANSACIAEPLNTLLDKFNAMFGNGAFVSQYVNENCSRDDLEEARCHLEQVLADYSSM